MVAVSNATPLIYLAKANCLELLERTYRQVYASPDVWREIIQPIFSTRPIPEDVPMILKARSDGWLKLRDLKTTNALAIRDELISRGLGVGDANSVALAKEMNALFLANDESAILAARRYGVETRWFTEMLHDALRMEHLKNVEEYTSLLDECIARGLYMSKRARHDAIRTAERIVAR